MDLLKGAKHKKWVEDVKKYHQALKAKCARGEPVTQTDIDGLIVLFGGGGPGDGGEGP